MIVDFWATFCDPCERSFPHYEALQERFGGNVAVIAVSVDSPADVEAGGLRTFAQRTGATFPILWDADGSLQRLYQPRRLPTSYIIDQAGHIAYVHPGYEAGDIEIIEHEVEALLARMSVASPVDAGPTAGLE